MTSPSSIDIIGLRHQAGLTQQQVADLMGLSQRTIQRWERGERIMHQAFWELLRSKIHRRLAQRSRP